YSRTSSQLVGRTRDQIARYFDGLEMVEPGLVYLPRWHPEGDEDLFLDEPERAITLGGVGRMPGGAGEPGRPVKRGGVVRREGIEGAGGRDGDGGDTR